MQRDFYKHLTEAKCFNIYNMEVKEVIDCTNKNSKTLQTMWHLNNGLNQKFRFLKDENNTNQSRICGFIESIDLKDNFLSVSADFTILLDSKNQASYVSFEFNEQGFAQITVYPFQQTQKLLVPKKTDKNQKYSEHYTLGLQEFEEKNSSFSWAILTIDEGTFDNQTIILRTIKDGLPFKGLNTQTGQRFMSQEDFNIYEQSKYMLRAQYNKNSVQYSFQQIAGENYMSVTQNAVSMSPFSEKKSEWTVIRNLINNEFYFMSRESFQFLSHKQQFMIIEEPCIIKGKQSFTIQQEITTKDESNVEEQEQEEGHSINSLSSSHIQMAKLNQLRVVTSTYKKDTDLIDLDFSDSDLQEIHNSDVLNNPLNEQSDQTVNQFQRSNFSLNSFFGESNSVVEVKIKNKGSNKYLLIEDSKNIEETSEIKDASIFKIKKDQLNQCFISIFLGDSPVCVRRLNCTSAVAVLDPDKADSQQTKFQVDIPSNTLRFQGRVLTIVGGMLFVVAAYAGYQNSSESKQYQQFEFFEISKNNSSGQGEISQGNNFDCEQNLNVNGNSSYVEKCSNQNSQSYLLQENNLPIKKGTNDQLNFPPNTSLNEVSYPPYDSKQQQNYQQQQQQSFQQQNIPDYLYQQSLNGQGQHNQLLSQQEQMNYQQQSQAQQQGNMCSLNSQNTQMEIENYINNNGNNSAHQIDQTKDYIPLQIQINQKKQPSNQSNPTYQ